MQVCQKVLLLWTPLLPWEKLKITFRPCFMSTSTKQEQSLKLELISMVLCVLLDWCNQWKTIEEHFGTQAEHGHYSVSATSLICGTYQIPKVMTLTAFHAGTVVFLNSRQHSFVAMLTSFYKPLKGLICWCCLLTLFTLCTWDVHDKSTTRFHSCVSSCGQRPLQHDWKVCRNNDQIHSGTWHVSPSRWLWHTLPMPGLHAYICLE